MIEDGCRCGALDGGEEAPAVIIFTSGTAGRPKAVEPWHRSLLVDLQMLLQLTRRLPHQVDEHPAMPAMWHLQQEPLPINQTGKIGKSALAAAPAPPGPVRPQDRRRREYRGDTNRSRPRRTSTRGTDSGDC
jgi:hypothetical protein